MNAKQQAFADLKRLSQFSRGLAALAPDLEKLGSLEQGVAEAESRLTKLATEQARAQTEWAAIATKRDLAVVEEKARAAKAKDEAAALISDAKAEAEKIRASAQASATAMVIEAQAKTAEFQKKEEVAQHRLDAIEATITERETFLGSLTSKISSVKEALAGIH